MVKIRVSSRMDLAAIEEDLAEAVEQYLGEAAEALTQRQRAAVCSRLAEMASSLMQKIQRNVILDDGELPDSDDDNDNVAEKKELELADVLQGDDESRALESEIVQLVEQLMKARHEVPERLAAEANAQLLQGAEAEGAQDSADPGEKVAVDGTDEIRSEANPQCEKGKIAQDEIGANDENSMPSAAEVVQLLKNAKEMLPRIKETLEIQRIKLEKIVTEAEKEQKEKAENRFTTPERVLMSSQVDNREDGKD